VHITRNNGQIASGLSTLIPVAMVIEWMDEFQQLTIALLYMGATAQQY